jgi:hypothetical protein
MSPRGVKASPDARETHTFAGRLMGEVWETFDHKA